MSKIFVTGASGYLATNLIIKLLDQGHYVVGLVRNQKTFSPKNPNLTIIDCDEIKAIAFHMKNSDFVIHLASSVVKENNLTSKQICNLVEDNFTLGIKILHSMVQSNVHNIIFAGSYWQRSKIGTETPIDLYSSLKSAFVQILKNYHHIYGIRGIALLFHDIYGPNDPRNKIIKRLLDWKLGNTPIKMTMGYQQIMPLFIDDALDAIITCFNEFRDYEKVKSYTISGSEILSIRDIVKIVEQIKEYKINVNWGEMDHHGMTIEQPDNSNPMPNWQAKTSFTDGINNLLLTDLELKG